MAEEILRIGSSEVTSEPETMSCDAFLLYSLEGENLSSQIFEGDKNDKGIEVYPAPLAVVGVSVL